LIQSFSSEIEVLILHAPYFRHKCHALLTVSSHNFSAATCSTMSANLEMCLFYELETHKNRGLDES